MKYNAADYHPLTVPDMPPYEPPMTPYLSVLYQDEDLLFLDKPSGLLTVPGRGEGMQDCLESRVQQQFPAATIVHRLDMETSGVVVMTRHKDAHREISRQFEMRETEKVYEALVWGHMTEERGEVDEPLICDWPNRPMQKICYERGKKSVTRYEVLGIEGDYTRVALYPVTGRSHQLRVHMLHLGHPIIGDTLYARGPALAASDRLCLHAKTLSVTHPESKEKLTLSAPVGF